MIIDRSLLPLVPGVRRIAVLRANALGDLIFSLPALYSLRVAYPAAEIVLLGRPLHRELLTGRPSPVDRVEVVPPTPGLVGGEAGPGEDSDAFLERMRGERFDIGVQMHGGGRTSNPFVLQLGARVTVGMRAADAPALDRWMPYVYYQPEVARYLELVSLVGARAVTMEPSLAVTERDRRDVAEKLGLVGQYAVLHAGASDVRRRWPAEGFAAVGDALAEAGTQVVLTGTGAERATVEAVAARMRARPRLALDLLGYGGLAALLSDAVVVVSNDTGPLHLADAVGARSVGVYWCGNLVNGAPFNRTRHRPLASWRSRCPVCGADCTRTDCGHEVSFVSDVTATDVIGAALDLAGAEWVAA